jgi:hypothetical protein
MISRLDEDECTARLDDGTQPRHDWPRLGKRQASREPDYARGIPGRGANSDAQPSVAPSRRDSRETALAKRVLAAAIELYECDKEAARLNPVAIETALEEQLETFSTEQRERILTGLRYATHNTDG